MARIPDGWKNREIGDIAQVTSGGTPSRKEPTYWNGHIPWVSTGSINFSTIYEGNEYITQDGLNNSSAKLFPIKTILMAMYGQGMTRGRVAILGIEATTNQACSAIMVNDSVDYKFVYYYLASQYLRIREMGHGGNQKNLNGSLVKQIPISLPPLAEQKAIAQILGTWDEAIATAEALIETLTLRKRALMQRLLTGEVRFPEFDDEWEEVIIDQVLQRIRRKIDVDKDKIYHQIGIRSHGRGIFHKDGVTGDEIGNKRIFWIKPSDFILNIVFAWECAVAIVSENEEGMCGSHRFPTYRPRNNLCDTRYLLSYFQTDRGIEQLGQASPGGAGRNRTLNQKEFMNLRMKIPSLEEQQKIVEVLDLSDETIKGLQDYLEALQEQKRGLMQVLLTGQVRVDTKGN